MRVGIYARYSSEKQGQGYSIEVQLGACRASLPGGGAGHTITEYVDRAKSGTTIAGRTELMRLLGDAANGKMDRVVVYKFDRLGRNQAETAMTIQDLEDAGVRVASATEGDDPLARGIHIVMSDYYVRQLSERTHAGCIKAAEVGRIGGPAPFGYRRNANGQLAVEPETSEIVKRIFGDYVEGGLSLKGIARALNAEGILSPSGREWHASSVFDILRNEVYVGKHTFNRRRYRRNRRTGRRVYSLRPASEWLVVDCPDLAIVSRETFEAVQRRRLGRSPQSGGHRRTYALSGVVVCSQCGSSYVAQKSKNSKGEYAYMACGSRSSGGKCENRFRFREDLVRAEMMRQVWDALFTEEATEKLKESVIQLATRQLEEGSSELQAVGEHIAACQKKVADVMALMIEAKGRGDGTDSLWAEELAKQNANLAALKERQKELECGPRLDIKHLSEIVDRAIERQKSGLIEVAQPDKIREALRLLVGHVVAHPDGTLTYETRPANLLAETDGSCVTLVAGAGFEPATFRL